MTTAPALCVSSLRYRIGERILFNRLDLIVRPGESVAVLGPSGSGKSTLLSCLLGLITPMDGSILVNGHDLIGVSPRRLARLRSREIGMVFQFGELLPELSPVGNVALAALLGGDRHQDAFSRAQELLSELGVPHADTVETLSGGERQRTAVARALINRPSLLLADEPTGALDTANRDKVCDMLFAVPQRHNCGLLIVTHDLEVAARADMVYAIQGGRLVDVDLRQGTLR